MDATTTTPPLPISDLHRLQLEYQCLTPVSSNGSGSPRESEYPCLPDYLPQPQLQYYSPHPHHANPHQPPPSYYHQQHPHPHQQHQHQHQEPHQQHPYLKAEYGYMPFDMAGVPHAVPQELVGRNDFSDDGSKAGVVEMDQEEVDAIIRNKRKVRDPKACYACHRRKVKCDRNLPCDSCVKRDHPELCSYERPTKKRRIALSNALAQADGGESERIINSGPNITVPKEQWERINRELAQLKTQHKDTGDTPSPAGESQSMSGMMSQSDESFGEREGVHAPSNQMGTMHLGSRSVLAYMIGNRTKSTQDAAMSLLEENILPNLGLDNETTTYPFVDLWSTDSNSQNVDGLIKALPDDHLCREFWLTYRDIPCTIYPVVPDCDAFNQTVNFMLQTRADMTQANTPVDPNRPYGVTLPWLALFFAVLASGSQSTGRPAKERELTSQVYICCSYQALRMSNFLTHPSLETMQALLIIGNALSYNMNPGVSYILLGMTLRSAFSMGLHVPSSQTFSEQEQYHRSRIWWALAWQDSHFSVSYDRPSASILCAPELPYTKQSSPGARSYVESMANIIKVTQSILRDRQSNPKQAMSLATIIKYKDEVHRIWSEALPRLRNRHQCVSMTDHLERLALSLHCAYMISEICRPVLKEDHHSLANEKQSPLVSPSVTRRKSSMSSGSPGSTPGDSQTIALLRAECINYLEKVVETYVELREINKFAARSWIGIQRSISAAFLLGVLPETKQEPRVIRLLTQLERGIEQSAIEDSGFPIELDATGARKLSGPEGPSRDAPLWVRSMTKSLNALSKLNVALSGGKAAAAGQFPNVTSSFNGAPQQHQHQQMHVHQSQAAPPPPQMGMYNTPNMSPTASNMIAPVPMTMQQQFPMMHNMQSPTHMSGPSLSMGGPQMIPTMGPFSPDSSMSEPWNYGNLTERALEYVQPGLWG